jgi:hypothetical protein
MWDWWNEKIAKNIAVSKFYRNFAAISPIPVIGTRDVI